MTAADVTPGSAKRAWWKCSEGPDHEWYAIIGHRTGGSESGCPFCAGKRVSVTNSLKALYPEVARQEERAPRESGLRPLG